jgi:hypothetical protein
MQNTVNEAMMTAPGLSGNSEATNRSTDNFNRTVFGRLLWKDWRVVRQVVVAIAVIMPVLQLLLVMLSFGILARGGPHEDILGPTVLITMLAPTFIALGCSGMLIGHERQTGTWGWSSVLPTSWRSALLSKLVVTLSACLVVFCISAIIPSVLIVSGQLPFVSFRSEFALIPLVTFLVWFEIIAFFYLALLLFREPLVALVVGAIAVSTAQLIVIGLLTRATTDFLMRTGLVATRETAEIVLMFSLGTIFFLTGTACMVWAFRWRWTYGQTTPLGVWRGRLRSSPVKAIEYRIRKNVSPTELGSQFVLAFQQMLGLRLLVITGLVPAVSWLNRYELRDMLSAVVFQAIGILGATTFAGDQSLGRFRFLADRGVSPAKLVTTRLIVAMGFVLVGLAACKLGMSIGSPRFGLELTGHASPSSLLLAFSIGALGSLCFRRPIIAVTVTVILLGFCGAALLGLYKDARNGMLAGSLPHDIFYKLYSSFLLVCACVFLAAVYKIAYTWCSRDRVNLELRYFAVFPLAIVVSLLALLHVGFLLQPSYDPKEFPVVTLEYDLRQIPEIRDERDLFKAIDITEWSQATNPRYSHVFNGTTNPHSDAYALIVRSIKEKEATGEKWPEQAKADLSKLDAYISWTSSSKLDLQKQVWNWNPLLAKLAIAGRLASAEGEFELSKQAWQKAKQLLDVNSAYLYPFTQEGRSMVWCTLGDLTDGEIAGLGGPQAVRDLCPKLFHERNSFGQTSLIHTILTLSAINGELPGHESGAIRMGENAPPWFFRYPPVKWFIMRTVVAEYHNIISPESRIPMAGYPAIAYQQSAGEFLARLDRLQAAADQSDQSDRTDL